MPRTKVYPSQPFSLTPEILTGSFLPELSSALISTQSYTLEQHRTSPWCSVAPCKRGTQIACLASGTRYVPAEGAGFAGNRGHREGAEPAVPLLTVLAWKTIRKPGT